jgi:phage-related tail fiber protein
MINFPETPALNLEHTEGGKTWKFNGTAWVGVGSTTISWDRVSGKPTSFTPTSHSHTPSEVGLSNVSNTSDLDKPVSTATQTALNAKANSSHTHPLSQLEQSAATAGQVPAWNASESQWKPTTLDFSWNDLNDRPSLFSGSYADLSNVPATFPPSTHSHPLSQLDQSGAATGQVPTWDATSSAWVPQTPAAGSGQVTLTGAVNGSGTGTIETSLSDSGVASGTYKSVTVDIKGRVTGGTNPTTLSGYGITDAVASNISGATGATAVTNMMQITLAGYNALGVNVAPNTLYIIVG